MSNPSNEQLIENRKLLQNPYAHMDEIVCSDALASKVKVTHNQLENNKLMGNPYASLSTMHSNTIPPKKTRMTNSELLPNLRSMQDPYASVPGNTVKLSKYAVMGNPYARINEANAENDQHISRFEKLARDIHIKLWKHRKEFWPNGVPADPVELLDPSVAFRSIGYTHDIYETLDDYSNGEKFKIAGLIDQNNKKAYVSNQFSPEIQRFTSAHELGHALMHQGSGLHRDRALDGSPVNGKKDKIETEADKFAAFFLMPKNLVINRFEKHFSAHAFILNDATMFALDPGNKMNLIENKKNLRFISRILAETDQYNSHHFIPLSKQFRVSVEAMAIRLEELELIQI